MFKLFKSESSDNVEKQVNYWLSNMTEKPEIL
jgi:hypothetical protein